MGVIDSVLSFVPLIMIILLVGRIVKSSGRKKRPKPINTIPSAEKREPGKINSGAPVHARKLKKINTAGGDFVSMFERLGKGPQKEAAEEAAGDVPGPAVAQEPSPPSPQKQKTENLNVLQKEKDAPKPDNTRPAPVVVSEGTGRIRKLTELKKAVVWAEILGKPKGLD